MTGPPAERAIPTREARAEILHDLDRTLFVEAGAGTGKTSALVGRIVELVRRGEQLSGIAAITFTEAAAAELRERLRHELEQAARRGDVPPDALAQLDEAAVCTLHAFAQRLIAQFPLEAGLPPAFEVLDEASSVLELRRRFDAYLDELFADPALETVWMTALAAGFKAARLLDLARIFHDHRDRLPDPFTVPPMPDLDAGPLLSAIDDLLALAPACTDPADGLLARLSGSSKAWDQARHRLAAAAGDRTRLLHVLCNDRPPPRGKAGSKKGWGDLLGAAIAAHDRAQGSWDSLLGAVCQHVTAVLAEQVRQFTHAFAAERVAGGRLVFHDLLVLARDLLRDNPHVRRRLARRWQRLLIDEFQDTDPLQLEIAMLLASPASPEASAPAPPEPGRLFFVGDAKQSIYRFRRADITTYRHTPELFGSAVLSLDTNFRSVPGIIAWINAVFAELFTGTPACAGTSRGDEAAGPNARGGGAEGQAAHQPLTAARAPLTEGPAVRMLGDAHEGTAGEARTREATDVAAAISAALDERWLVERDGIRRPAQPRDIAVLIPSRTVLPHLEAALDAAALPYRIESSSLVWNTDPVRDLLALLGAIAAPGDPLAIVAALRTPALACSDRDLVTWHAAGGEWRANAPLPPRIEPEHRVAKALAYLCSMAEQRWFLTVGDLADRIARELRLFELALARREPREAWRSLRFVIEQARAFDEHPGATVVGFLEWAALQASDVAKVREPSLPEDDHDAVRILTIHGAKGLEFPICVLCGLNVNPSGAESTAVVWEAAQEPQLRLGTRFQTAGFGEARAAEQELDLQERRRLLYVAATRARDHLIVSLHRSERSHNCDAAALDAAWRRADPHQRLAVEWSPPSPAPPPSSRTSPRGDALPPKPAADIETWAAAEADWARARQALIARTRRAPVFAATAVADLQSSPSGPPAGEPYQPGSEHRGDAGTAIGRAVHAVLQTIDLSAPHNLREAARAQAEAEQIPEHAPSIERLARAAVDNDVVREALSHRHWRELYVAAPLGQIPGAPVIEGFVDLLYEAGGELVMVDYKTDSVDSEAGMRSALDRYRLQLGAYAIALERTTGRAVSRAALLLLSAGPQGTVWIDDLSAAKSAVESVLAAAVEPLA